MCVVSMCMCVHARVCVGVGVSYVCYCVSSTQASLFDL